MPAPAAAARRVPMTFFEDGICRAYEAEPTKAMNIECLMVLDRPIERAAFRAVLLARGLTYHRMRSRIVVGRGGRHLFEVSTGARAWPLVSVQEREGVRACVRAHTCFGRCTCARARLALNRETTRACAPKQHVHLRSGARPGGCHRPPPARGEPRRRHVGGSAGDAEPGAAEAVAR